MAFDTDVFNQNCPSRKTLEIISDKWVVLIMRALMEGTKRFGELHRRIQGISQKMLTQTLKNLERDGLVHRETVSQKPLHVDYRLTQIGQELMVPLNGLCDWSKENWTRIERVREAAMKAYEASKAQASRSKDAP